MKSNIRYEIGCPFGKSDHKSISAHSAQLKNISNLKSCLVRDFRRSKIDAFVNDLSTIDFDAILRNLDLNDKVDTVNNILNEVLNHTIPCTKIVMTSSDKPWMTARLKTCINERWSAYRTRNFGKYNALKNRIRNEILLAKKNWVDKEIDRCSPRHLWKVVNSLSGRDTGIGVCSLLKYYNYRYSTEIMVNDINNHFISKFLPTSQTGNSNSE